MEEQLSIPRVVISGTRSGAGKSFLISGLAHELRRRGVSASFCVVGPHLMQSTVLRRISARFVHCIDERLLTAGQILTTIYRAGIGADIVIIDGRDGLFDTVNGGGAHESDAELALRLRCPLVLVADGRGFGETIGVMVKGLMQYATGLAIGAVVINRTEGASRQQGAYRRDREFYGEVFRQFSIASYCGAVPLVGGSSGLPEQSIDQMNNCTALPFSFLNDMAEAVRSGVQIDRILELSRRAGGVAIEGFTHAPLGRRCRIAVSEDTCFSICFQDNLELLRYFGAELVTFSPLADEEVPRRVGAIYLSGAFLDEYGEELANNISMRRSLRAFFDRGGVIYAEGSAVAYLCRSFESKRANKCFDGVGLIEATAVVGAGSMEVIDAITIEESILGRPGMLLKGVSTGEWALDGENAMTKVFKLAKPGAGVHLEGFSPGPQVLASFCFYHFGSNPHIARNLVDAAEVVSPL